MSGPDALFIFKNSVRKGKEYCSTITNLIEKIESDDFKSTIKEKVMQELERNHNFSFEENIREEKCVKCKGTGVIINEKKKSNQC